MLNRQQLPLADQAPQSTKDIITMNFDRTEDQKMLAEQARKLLEESASPDRLRELIDSQADFDQTLWQQLGELGFLGAAISEAYGGIGMTAMELATIAEEIGRANAAVPFTSSIVLAAKAIELAGSEDQKNQWLPKIATGQAIACYSPSAENCEYNEGTLTGLNSPVADGSYAHIAVVACLDKGKPALALVELAQDQVSRNALNSFDELRPFAALEFSQAKAELLAAADYKAVVEQVSLYGASIMSFEQIGGSEACLMMARDYALERQIFSRPLAGYQAIKHKLAEMFVDIEVARSNAMYAVWALSNNAKDCEAAVAVARISALAAFENAARENLQTHGGIGYTFEANCHFYYRRERLLASWLGGKNPWSKRLIDAVQAA